MSICSESFPPSFCITKPIELRTKPDKKTNQKIIVILTKRNLEPFQGHHLKRIAPTLNLVALSEIFIQIVNVMAYSSGIEHTKHDVYMFKPEPFRQRQPYEKVVICCNGICGIVAAK